MSFLVCIIACALGTKCMYNTYRLYTSMLCVDDVVSYMCPFMLLAMHDIQYCWMIDIIDVICAIVNPC